MQCRADERPEQQSNEPDGREKHGVPHLCQDLPHLLLHLLFRTPSVLTYLYIVTEEAALDVLGV